jgi:putative heme-binding domain-containing protein
LEEIAGGQDPKLRLEAERVLRLVGQRAMPVEEKPAADNLADWAEVLSEAGDAEAGRRLFFSSVGARCGVCHQHSGRGGRIGPDLTRIGETSSREQIIASILQSSRDIAPEYQPWILTTTDGKTHTGLRQPKGGDDGQEPYVDAKGEQFTLASDSIDVRQASPTSIMPDGLQNAVSLADLRDLVTFLTAGAAE